MILWPVYDRFMIDRWSTQSQHALFVRVATRYSLARSSYTDWSKHRMLHITLKSLGLNGLMNMYMLPIPTSQFAYCQKFNCNCCHETDFITMAGSKPSVVGCTADVQGATRGLQCAVSWSKLTVSMFQRLYTTGRWLKRRRHVSNEAQGDVS